MVCTGTACVAGSDRANVGLRSHCTPCTGRPEGPLQSMVMDEGTGAWLDSLPPLFSCLSAPIHYSTAQSALTRSATVPTAKMRRDKQGSHK